MTLVVLPIFVCYLRDRRTWTVSLVNTEGINYRSDVYLVVVGLNIGYFFYSYVPDPPLILPLFYYKLK
ncbi:hypothetical protein L218DRAFT_957705 [Marasmius fiardii PR-910]|nr:hypothetical protein L218DRAFT_957705 [Marasmius fiardii PR-910]